MATGYTYPVKDGTVTDFPTFALQCARAFGALIEMRDDPADAPIRESKVSDYHENALALARTALEAHSRMMPADAERAAVAEHADAVERWKQRQAQKAAERNRYTAMLAQVEAWEPPTVEHVGLKEFMVQQLTESIRFDCSDSPYDAEPEKQTGQQWHAARTKSLMRDIEYHAQHHAEDIERARGRNAWVQQLRDSLQPQPVTP